MMLPRFLHINKNNNKVVALLTLVFISATTIEAQSTGKQKPNIIVVITDDQGMGDLGAHGNPYIKTPHLDDFYKRSVRFTNFHVATTCAPSRGAIMTGRHTNRLNVFHTISGRSLLYEDEVILPQVLAQHGYTNGMFGKWHLGDNYPYRAEDRGFHEVVRHGGGGITQSPDYWGNDYFNDTYWHNGKTETYEGYCTDVFFSEAINFIKENKNDPFFCYIATNAPHTPLNLPKKYIEAYKNVNGIDEKLKRFYGMITNIDDNFKLLEDTLKELDVAANTIVVFMTDNGTAGGSEAFNAGLRGQKGSEYDGGHRVPLFIRWPNGQISGGKDIDKLAAGYDLLPTFVELLGIDYNPIKPLDGKSLAPLLYDPNTNWPNRVLYIDTQRRQNLVKYKNYAVMDNDWRLVNGTELYRIAEDIGQTTNVISQHPLVAEKLALGYENWWQSIKDEGVMERYAYIKVGAKAENPSRISTHDMHTGKFKHMWHQYGAITTSQVTGTWKIEVVADGDYKISLRRFPRESGLAINATFAAQEKDVQLGQTMPASTKSDFTKAYLYLANLEEAASITNGQEEVTFTSTITAGKYDMEAQLIDASGTVFPAYYVYIEKL